MQMLQKTNKYLIAAILIGIAFHGATMFFTLEKTYDALIHVFFASHYQTSWFEPWSYKWYTGFTVMGYPPLVHQSIALLSEIGGLLFGMYTIAITGVVLFITGIYRFALLLTSNRTVAGYAALLAVFSSSLIETLHVFGQLPSLIGLSVLLHALPEIYNWLATGKYKHLLVAFSLIAVTVSSHHVTPIFGMIFFIFPLIGMAIMDAAKDQYGTYKAITFGKFIRHFKKMFVRIVTFGFGSLALILICILPYWINSKNNPITQVPIPHGSRDNFLEVLSSGLVFFIIPWGILLFLMPYLFYRFFSKRYLFFGMSLGILTLLGSGGTTPLPLKILGENAFNILTLDRFTLWASVMVLPIFGEFAYRFVEGDLRAKLQQQWSAIIHRLSGGVLVICLLGISIFTLGLTDFRPSQPTPIKMLPIVNFLSQDQHDNWRYLPLGFGDQMAWLSAQTNALTVDGNYHSARRLPELTTRAVERLENSKFRGLEGLGSLQQFLTVPEKYHLKYVFSNDKFYDPMLYFSGWHRLQQLENGIMVWERSGVAPLPTTRFKQDVPRYQKLMWGIIPILTVVLALFLNLSLLWKKTLKNANHTRIAYEKHGISYELFSSRIIRLQLVWIFLLLGMISYGMYQLYLKNATQLSPENVVKAYYDALDFKEFDTAYQFINPLKDKTKSQYMLEISVGDGLLSSYAKLDAIDVTTLESTESSASVEVQSTWITPLKSFQNTEIIRVEKVDNRWFVNPNPIDLDIPPDQFISENKTVFYNHGRRRITSGPTYHEDVLKQPVLEVLSAQLIKEDSSYAIVGRLQNVDNFPADVSIKGTLFTSNDIQVATYNANDLMKHKLLPKETTSFKINFGPDAWENLGSSTGLLEPVKFNLQVSGNVATTDLYDGLAIQKLTTNSQGLKGTLLNTGTQNATIPQLIISYHDRNQHVVWVDKVYLEESVRPQRKQEFELSLRPSLALETISNTTELVFVNGLPNASISDKIVPNRKPDSNGNAMLKINGVGYDYVSVKVNTYIGNPN